jgi:hypothetical protein
MVDVFARPPERTAFATTQSWLPEQYVLQNTQIIKVDAAGVRNSNGMIAIEVPALHDHLITARLNVSSNARTLQQAQHHLESVLLDLERRFPPTPSGLGVAVAWGLPYFHHYIPRLSKTSSFFRAGTAYPAYLPVDLVTSKMEGRTVYAVQEAMTFPSDQPPPGFGPVRLEQNDVAVLLRSDSLSNVYTGMDALFGSGSKQAGNLFKVTSIRQGFSGGGFYGQQGLPSKLGLAGHIPGAESIPAHAQGFLGFSTTLQANMGPGTIANLETLPGVTDQWPHGYFRNGTTLQLSHLFQDLASWYGRSFPTFADRVRGMFRPALSLGTGTLTANPPFESEANLVQDVQRYRSYGHSGSMQPIVRQTLPTTSNYGHVYPAVRPYRRAATSTPWTIPSTTRPTPLETGTTASRLQGCTSSSFRRRLATSIAHGSPWTDTIPTRPSTSRPAPTMLASIRYCKRPTGRTTWFRLVSIAHFRSWSFWSDADQRWLQGGSDDL